MIERLTVQNYRCLENFTLDLTETPSALLIGRNGSGKSTVLHALRVLQKIGRGSNRAENIVGLRDFASRKPLAVVAFEVALVLGGERYTYSASFEESFTSRVVIHAESLSKNDTQVFKRGQAGVTLASGSGFSLDPQAFALNVVIEQAPASSIQTVRSFLAGLIIVEPIPHLMWGFSPQPVAELMDHAENYASCLRALFQKKPVAYSAVAAYLKEIIPDFAAIEYADRGSEGGSQLRVTFEQPRSGAELSLDFDQLSAGEKCFFLAAYVIAASEVGLPIVCFWDEPDNHLSLSEVGHFIMALRKTTNRGAQFIATSHHPEAVHKFSDENTFVLTRNSHLEPTVIKPLSAYDYAGDLVHALTLGDIIG